MNAPPPKNLLIIDDNTINRQILGKILSTDYHLLEAENGEVALSILREKHDHISAVLLDIVMPVMDGYEVLRQMHADPVLSKIPVIVISGQGGEDAERKALSLGANDFIVKPYKPTIIKLRISNTIYLRETAAFINSVQNDALTGVFSKEYFYLKAGEILKNNPDKRYDIICLDIERFKLFNDMYGTQLGDELLKHVGAIVTNNIRSYGICGRLGADEFACLIEHRDHYEKKYFLNTNAQVNQFKNMKLNLNLCYGIYCIDDRSIPVSIMCDRAILAKESIKGKYDTYFACYDYKIMQKLLDEQCIVSGMKTALTDDQFQVYFQPKYNIKTNEIIGAEALARWRHPEKGLLLPGEFIPIFEKNGFITDFDIHIWEQCCQKLHAWNKMGNRITPLSINISRADIYNTELPLILSSMVEKYEIDPALLHLEITETAYTENPEQLIDTTLKLKQLGFVIEMDDFGSGYSSLNMLSELPIDILKLDIRFIQKGQKDRDILNFIVQLAKWMKLGVIAEGVETEEQALLLQSIGCEQAQGYYYSRPLPQKEFEQLLLDTASKNKK